MTWTPKVRAPDYNLRPGLYTSEHWRPIVVGETNQHVVDYRYETEPFWRTRPVSEVHELIADNRLTWRGEVG